MFALAEMPGDHPFAAPLTPTPLVFAPPFNVGVLPLMQRLDEIADIDDAPFAYRYVEMLQVQAPPAARYYTNSHETTDYWTNLDGCEQLDLDSDYVIDDGNS